MCQFPMPVKLLRAEYPSIPDLYGKCCGKSRCQFPTSAHPTDPSETPRIRFIYLHIPHINTCDTTTRHNAPAMRTTQHAGKSLTLEHFLWLRNTTSRHLRADVDATARRKVRWRAIVLGLDWSRDDVAGIWFADALPQKYRARPPGADIGGVGAFAVSELPVFKSVSLRNTIFAASSPTSTPPRVVKFCDAPLY